MNGTRYVFLDWLKCLGMTVIVYGHVAGWAPLADFAPIRLKQLGVALFLFSLGYSLARDSRDGVEVVFKRLFELYLFGLAVALIVSAGGLIVDGRWRGSNYIPFLGGINVLFDFFPANPTSWYIGTYVHFVLLGAWLVRRVRVSGTMLVAAFCSEVLIRAAVMGNVGTLVAYMVAPNWMTVFLLGAYFGQRQVLRIETRWWIPAGSLAIFGIGWLRFSKLLSFGPQFPFMLPTSGGTSALLVTSVGVSTLYVVVTFLTFATVSNLRRSSTVEFLARHTMLIFLAHMPVYYALLPLMRVEVFGWSLRSAILMAVCIPGLAVMSEAIHRTIGFRSIRDRAFVWFAGFAGQRGPATVTSGL